jgi:hypothetical protein
MPTAQAARTTGARHPENEGAGLPPDKNTGGGPSDSAAPLWAPAEKGKPQARPFGRFARKRPTPAPAAQDTAWDDDGFGPDGFARMMEAPRSGEGQRGGTGESHGGSALAPAAAPPAQTRKMPARQIDDRPPLAPPQPYGRLRTGRPGKMTFRQGEPGDLDAIDE